MAKSNDPEQADYLALLQLLGKENPAQSDLNPSQIDADRQAQIRLALSHHMEESYPQRRAA
ncbi:MAG: hypothetical protein K2X27_16715 [Candidatus Obscuribacterales bacterium]|nr:hypothetical protein [Candidatus Obscuribacterales bacterium]